MAERLGINELGGPYLSAALLSLLAFVFIVLFLRPDPLHVGRSLAAENRESQDSPVDIDARPLREILSGGSVRLALAALIIGQLVMTLLMVIAPLHMDHHNHTTRAISWVIMAHTVGMFGLASVTGWLVDRIGRIPVVAIGAAILAVSSILTPLANGVPMLAFALFLLGLGWSFSFVAGSSLLTNALLPGERGRTQGASEMMVALASGAGSLGTGFVFAAGGIVAVSTIGLVLSLLLAGATLWRRTPRKTPQRSEDLAPS